MTEPEASLRFALYYIKNNLTEEDVTVNLDGAHIKAGGKVYFPIADFMREQGLTKVEGKSERWQGVYAIKGYKPHIRLSAVSGKGDIVIREKTGTLIYAEAKKGEKNRSSQEYPLMREAIGQIMTGIELRDEIQPVVVVPDIEKYRELAYRWIKFPQIKKIGIWFALVNGNGGVEFVKTGAI